MRSHRCVLAAVMFAVAALVSGGCASEGQKTSAAGSADSVPDAPSGGTWDDGEPVKGNVSVTWKNLNPANPQAASSLVNESSEIGRKLKSGTASSSEIRVITDAQMGGMLSQMKELGFFDHATKGLGLDNVPDVPGRRGIVVVKRDDQSLGLMLTTNLGLGPIPKVYRDVKTVVLFAHSQVRGFDVKAGTGAPDETLFSAPKPTFRRP